MLSIREDSVYSSLRQNILEAPFQVLATSNPKLLGKFYIQRYTLLALDTEERDLDRLVEMCEHLLLSGKLISDGVDPWIGEFSYINPLIWMPNRLFINLETCSEII